MEKIVWKRFIKKVSRSAFDQLLFYELSLKTKSVTLLIHLSLCSTNKLIYTAKTNMESIL